MARAARKTCQDERRQNFPAANWSPTSCAAPACARRLIRQAKTFVLGRSGCSASARGRSVADGKADHLVVSLQRGYGWLWLSLSGGSVVEPGKCQSRVSATARPVPSARCAVRCVKTQCTTQETWSHSNQTAPPVRWEATSLAPVLRASDIHAIRRTSPSRRRNRSWFIRERVDPDVETAVEHALHIDMTGFP